MAEARGGPLRAPRPTRPDQGGAARQRGRRRGAALGGSRATGCIESAARVCVRPAGGVAAERRDAPRRIGHAARGRFRQVAATGRGAAARLPSAGARGGPSRRSAGARRRSVPSAVYPWPKEACERGVSVGAGRSVHGARRVGGPPVQRPADAARGARAAGRRRSLACRGGAAASRARPRAVRAARRPPAPLASFPRRARAARDRPARERRQRRVARKRRRGGRQRGQHPGRGGGSCDAADADWRSHPIQRHDPGGWRMRGAPRLRCPLLLLAGATGRVAPWRPVRVAGAV
mmetsp:Transcript_45557/g.148049  ORF Transcript_45557/g.148049 Transcript_45557/m.148049 type:complete len:291 (+) Transcript_45557:1421-2293(+)